MRPGLLLVLLAIASSVLAAPSTNNDDSCDIAVAPAATLLLPHFEVDLSARPGEGRTTVFNVINVSSYPQIARVTLWSDWAYPLVGFSVFLTGYDVQAIDLRDLLVRGAVPAIVPAAGPISHSNFSNPNFAPAVMSDCAKRMPYISGKLMTDIRSALTTGRLADSMLSCPGSDGSQVQIGSDHGGRTAIGFVTIDVVSTCSPHLPIHAEYYTSDLLYDNVLIGDYVFIDPKGERNGHATGSPLVHIRAVPEGGGSGQAVSTRLPRTFYGRFKPAVSDRRQPLPTTFAARYIEGGDTGFRTQVTIWREGMTGQNASCGDYRANSRRVTEIVRFDEHENATVHSARNASLQLAATSKISSESSIFPARTSEDNGGWFFINLADSSQATQNWIEVTLFAEGRFGAQFPAAALGNGCTPAVPAGARITPK